MKKFLNWLKSPKSDFALFIIVLILANLAAHNAFLRFDLTQPKSYSLSKASRQLVKTLEEPLSIRVFFDDNLPSPYSAVAQYVKDILVEYKGAANKNLTVTYMDMSKEQNDQMASDYGLHQIQIQEVKNNEVGFKQGYMGLVVSYGDRIEVLDAITSSDGFEYKLTSTISKMISTANTLAGLNENEKITLTLYMSNTLNNLGIDGTEFIKDYTEKAFKTVNKQNFDRLSYNVISPEESQIPELVEKYGIQSIQYNTRKGNTQKNTAVLGLVLEMNDNFRVLPLSIQRSLFGYGVAGLDELETSIADSLQSLVSKVTQIGYITGHNELDLANEKYSKNFDKLVSSAYELVELDLSEKDIPANMKTIIINGPQYDYTEEELYKIDQFILKGGNVMFFIDSMNQDGTANYYGSQPYVPNELNIDRLLNKYGLKRDYNYVMDEQCYSQNNTQYGKLNMYWVPVLQKKQLAKKHPITANLGYVIMLQNGSIDSSEAQQNKDVKVTVLARSSEKAWAETENIMLNPVMLQPPQDKSRMSSKDLAVLVEGKFQSAFDEPPVPTEDDEDDDEETEKKPKPVATADDDIMTANHISSSIQPGKIFLIGTSFVTTYQILDESGSSPIAMFLMNVVDYMNGNEELCTMRTKGLTVNTLEIKSANFAKSVQYFNEFGIAVLVAVAGFITWRLRVKRRKQIRLRYNPDDSREIDTIKKQTTEKTSKTENSENDKEEK